MRKFTDEERRINPHIECVAENRRLQQFLSDSWAREARMREYIENDPHDKDEDGCCLRRCPGCKEQKEILSQPASSWLKREKAKVWREAARDAVKACGYCKGGTRLLGCACGHVAKWCEDRAAALEAEAKEG